MEQKSYGYPIKWNGHENCAFSTFLRSVRGVAHPKLPAINPLHDPPPLHPALISACVKSDRSGRSPTAVDEAWLAALAEDLVHGGCVSAEHQPDGARDPTRRRPRRPT
jgi:hypothetical protein